jgi:hypothetical protein
LQVKSTQRVCEFLHEATRGVQGPVGA